MHMRTCYDVAVATINTVCDMQNWTASTLDFRYTDVGGLTHGLSIPELHDRISGAVLGRKPDRITITLTKVATGTTDVPLHWYELVKKK